MGKLSEAAQAIRANAPGNKPVIDTAKVHDQSIRDDNPDFTAECREIAERNP